MLFPQSSTFFAFTFVSLLVKFITPALAAHNVTVNNTDPSIQYSDHDWTFDDDYKSGATDHYAFATGAKATFQFTGVAVYYSVHLYPANDSAGATLSLDGNPGEDVQLSDPNARHYGTNGTIVWSKTGLTNTTHTLTAQILSNVDFITLDTIFYTALDPSDADSFANSANSSTSTPSSSSTPDSQSSPPPSGSSKEKNIAIALGAVLGTVLVGVVVGLLFCRRRKKMRLSPSSKDAIVTLSSDTCSAAPSTSDEPKSSVPIAESDVVSPSGSTAASTPTGTQNGYRFLPEVERNDGRVFNASRTTEFSPLRANFNGMNAVQRTPPIQVYPMSVGSNWQTFNHPASSGGPNSVVDWRTASESDQMSTVAVTGKTPPPTYIIRG